MIEVGTILYFIPPKFAGGKENENKIKRLMVVININYFDNTLTLINISKLEGKPRWFTYPFNYLIKNYDPPLPLPSFAKLNDNYIIENFKELNKYIFKDGTKLNEIEVKNIVNRRLSYLASNPIDQISFSKEEILFAN